MGCLLALAALISARLALPRLLAPARGRAGRLGVRARRSRRARDRGGGQPGSDRRWLVFDASAVTHVDVTGLTDLREIAGQLAEEGVALAFARVSTPTRERLDESG